MRNTWTSIAGLGVCSLLGVLLLSDTGWAAPKKDSTSVTCKCTCAWEDELGKTQLFDFGLFPGQPYPGPDQIRGNTCIARIQYRITYNLRAYPNL
jgi:hypothetical protein